MAEKESSLFKERLFAIVIGILMIGSAAGYAFMSALPKNSESVASIPTIVKRPLSIEEQVFILRSGRVLIENFYQENCSSCLERNSLLESFAKRLEGYVVLESVVANETKLDMIGVNGRIVNIDKNNLTEDYLLDVFCDIAGKIPKSCLLREI